MTSKESKSHALTKDHLESFGGHFVTSNSNLIMAIDSAFKKNYKKDITGPKVTRCKKVRFSGH